MRKEIWLARHSSGSYGLYRSKPMLTNKDNIYWHARHDKSIIQSCMCEQLVKEWFGLKKHLKKGTCIQGYFNISFKPIGKVRLK